MMTAHLALPLTHDGIRWSLALATAVLLSTLTLLLLSRYQWEVVPAHPVIPITVHLLPEMPTPVVAPAPVIPKPAASTPAPAHSQPMTRPHRTPAVKLKRAARPKPQPLPATPPAEPAAALADLQPGPATGPALPPTPEQPQAASGEAAATAQVPGAGDAPAAYLGSTPLLYPEQARRRGWEGTVLLRVQLDVHGRVQAVTVLQSSGYPVLDQAAASQISSWRFKPSLHDGKPQPSTLRVPVKFRLEKS